MTTRATARHRAEVTKTNSLAVIAKAVGDNAGGMGRQAAVIAAASGLVLTSGIAANAAETNVQREATSASALEVQSAVAPANISAASRSPSPTRSRLSPPPRLPSLRLRSPLWRSRISNTGGSNTGGSNTGGAQAGAAGLPPPRRRQHRQRQRRNHCRRRLRPARRLPGLHRPGHERAGRCWGQLPRLAGRLPVPGPHGQRC